MAMAGLSQPATAPLDKETSAPKRLYPSLLADAWARLAPAIRASHFDGEDVRREGWFCIRWGQGRLIRAFSRILRMPPEGDSIATTLEIAAKGGIEHWRRCFGTATLETHQWESSPGVLSEQFGRLELKFRLDCDDASIHYRQVGARLRLGPFGIPLPRFLSPRVEALEEADGPEHTHVRVAVHSPLLGLLAAYEGRLGKASAS